MNPARIGAEIGLRARLRALQTDPTPGERAIARAARAGACRELGVWDRPRLRFFAPDPADPMTGYYERPGTIWICTGQTLNELVRSVRHEVGHAAQYEAAGRRGVTHDGRKDWQRSTVERYARGSRKARRRLRQGLTITLRIGGAS